MALRSCYDVSVWKIGRIGTNWPGEDFVYYQSRLLPFCYTTAIRRLLSEKTDVEIS